MSAFIERPSPSDTQSPAWDIFGCAPSTPAALADKTHGLLRFRAPSAVNRLRRDLVLNSILLKTARNANRFYGMQHRQASGKD
jgi:hypothetical protein